jgi:hypothetical protein
MENIASLRSSWHRYWDPQMSICVRRPDHDAILASCFSQVIFVVIKRHPVAVSLAIQKWTISALHRLFEHWLHCYALFEEDKQHLTKVYEVRDEDYVQAPDKYHQEIATFVGSSFQTIAWIR